MKKLLSVICISTAFSLSAAVLSFAAQTDRWHSDSNGTWYLYNEAKTSNVVNSWFQDLDGAWYLLAPGDGHMYAGLIHDTITDKWYFCQTEHDGWYGRMASANGSYTVNGQSVYLTFNPQHDGTFGAITSGLESLQSTGIVTQDVAGIPEDSAGASASQDDDWEFTNNENEDWLTRMQAHSYQNNPEGEAEYAYLSDLYGVDAFHTVKRGEPGYDELLRAFAKMCWMTLEEADAFVDGCFGGGAGGHVDWE